MGQGYKATCSSCNHQFEASIGGGMAFELIRCTRCAETKSVGHTEIINSMRKADPELKHANKDFFNKHLEALAGSCTCGGKFKVNASVRCPECRSLDVVIGECTVCYD